ncbi:hypothetical protein L596_022621 [Steinernema carpocapsae]|uniref:Uncharacterized protein n=1 Tax=Steinernema carpocapsae TaxID=34508 RepID=A0A4U5MMA7_STECR|nr:hypothetical protein L596_022621 [Steinernema carpocapsae]
MWHLQPLLRTSVRSRAFHRTYAKNSDPKLKIYDKNFVLKPHDDPHAPLVAVLGFAGSTDRHLAKYSKVYEDRCTVVRCTAPLRLIPSAQKCFPRANDLYDKILLPGTYPKVIFHLLSGNGSNLFVALWKLLATVPGGEKWKRRTAGIIYDSTPSDFMPRNAAIAMSTATFPTHLQPKFPNVFIAYRNSIWFCIHVKRGITWVQWLWDRQAFERIIGYQALLKIEDLPDLHLFLYSKLDNITSYKDIETLMDVLRKRCPQGKVEGRLFDSGHVDHLKKYPDEYMQVCKRFMEDCLDGHRIRE